MSRTQRRVKTTYTLIIIFIIIIIIVIIIGNRLSPSVVEVSSVNSFKKVTISSWLNFGRPAPREGGVPSAAGRKFLAQPYYSQRTVFASLLSSFRDTDEPNTKAGENDLLSSSSSSSLGTSCHPVSGVVNSFKKRLDDWSNDVEL